MSPRNKSTRALAAFLLGAYLILPVLGVMHASGTSVSPQNAGRPRYHVSYYPNSAAAALQAVASAGGTVVTHHPEINLLFVDSDAQGFASVVASDPSIQYAVKDLTVQWFNTASAPSVVISSGTRRANLAGSPLAATSLSSQWNLAITRTIQAWSTTLGSNSVHVAILDTGIDAFHQETVGKIDTANSASFVTETGGCQFDNNNCPGCPPWQDRGVHGTHVAGIVSTNNIGTAGVAPNVILRAIKVANCNGDAAVSAIVNGIMYAANTGSDIINISSEDSFALSEFDPDVPGMFSSLRSAIDYAQKLKGCLVVCAAGNSGINLDARKVLQLTAQTDGMAVGATTLNDNRATSFPPNNVKGSNFGSVVALYAPGGGSPVAPAPATDPNQNVMAPCNSQSAISPWDVQCAGGTQYLFLNGTSQSTPHVAGAAALIASTLPAAIPRNTAFAVQFIKNKLLDTADKVIIQQPGLGPGGTISIQAKRLDVFRAVQ
jgi:subtilisin family serine protease